MVEYKSFDKQHLDGAIRLCEAEGWSSYTENPETTWQALTAPGSHTIVAVESDKLVGFVQLQSDGLIQAHLSVLCVARDRRRNGIGRHLVEEAFGQCGAKRIDVLATEGAEEFYRSFNHKQIPGYRLYPDRSS